MRTKKPFFIALFLCTWSIVSYYLLIRQTDSDTSRHGPMTSSEQRRHRDDLLRQLNRLETNIQEENIIHDQLVKKLIQIVRMKDLKDIGINKVSSYKSHNASNGNNIDTFVEKEVKSEANRVVNSLGEPATENGIKVLNSAVELEDSDILLINRLKELNKRSQDFKGPIIPVLVFACNRISVRNCLDDLIKYRPNSYQFPIIVSQVS